MTNRLTVTHYINHRPVLSVAYAQVNVNQLLMGSSISQFVKN